MKRAKDRVAWSEALYYVDAVPLHHPTDAAASGTRDKPLYRVREVGTVAAAPAYVPRQDLALVLKEDVTEAELAALRHGNRAFVEGKVDARLGKALQLHTFQ